MSWTCHLETTPKLRAGMSEAGPSRMPALSFCRNLGNSDSTDQARFGHAIRTVDHLINFPESMSATLHYSCLGDNSCPPVIPPASATLPLAHLNSHLSSGWR